MRIGSGGVVQSVQTPFDPDTVEISGYPKDTPLDQLCEFQVMFPGIRQVRFEPTYCVQYSEASQAAHVREQLDGKEWNGHTLSALFDMSEVIEPAQTMRQSTSFRPGPTASSAASILRFAAIWAFRK